ncbi:ion channel [Paracoccus sp. (in: a-proteobacteria)]|uniref:ion channel n=1 Tax=Paracoccus sp. TaxID=267 RepID=UPI00396CD0DA
MLALLIGFGLVFLMGIGHHFALLGLWKMTGDAQQHPNRVIIKVFLGLLVIHLLEIVFFAVGYSVLITWEGMGKLNQFDVSWSELIYFSGINFTTLGYTQIEASGPIRLVNMMQALGGFMVLTWSATFIYSVWKKALEAL